SKLKQCLRYRVHRATLSASCVRGPLRPPRAALPVPDRGGRRRFRLLPAGAAATGHSRASDRRRRATGAAGPQLARLAAVRDRRLDGLRWPLRDAEHPRQYRRHGVLAGLLDRAPDQYRCDRQLLALHQPPQCHRPISWRERAARLASIMGLLAGDDPVFLVRLWRARLQWGYHHARRHGPGVARLRDLQRRNGVPVRCRDLAAARRGLLRAVRHVGPPRLLPVVFVVLVGVIWGLFAGFAAAVRAVGHLDEPLLDVVAGLLPSLVPIAFGYLLAHNFDYLAINGQLLIHQASDPFGNGLNIFGTVNYEPNRNLIPTAVVWYFEIVLIIGVHIAAVVLAHGYLGRVARTESQGRRAEWPWIAAMVGYTMTSLWLLAQPIVQEGIQG